MVIICVFVYQYINFGIDRGWWYCYSSRSFIHLSTSSFFRLHVSYRWSVDPLLYFSLIILSSFRNTRSLDACWAARPNVRLAVELVQYCIYFCSLRSERLRFFKPTYFSGGNGSSPLRCHNIDSVSGSRENMDRVFSATRTVVCHASVFKRFAAF